jgi:anaerobic magnesium-protoporphyrin IX monomethyl ester cyclase
VEHVKRTDPDIFFTTVAYPIKGTPYFLEVEDRVKNSKPWNVGSDREVGIRGRHSRQFYSHADKLLRNEVELERLTKAAVSDPSTVAELQNKIAEARANMNATAAEVEV